MALGHGLSVPRSWERWWPFGDTRDLHFDGTFHNGLFRPDRAFVTLAVGLIVVWLLPNTQELFSRLRPALWPTDARDTPSRPWLIWRPNWQWGCVFGLLSAASFVTLGGQSPFLYFRF
jgi:hypothetical protein